MNHVLVMLVTHQYRLIIKRINVNRLEDWRKMPLFLHVIELEYC